MHLRWSLVVSSLCAVVLCGCGGGGVDAPPLGQVTGTVTVDGEPIGDATVEFVPEAGGRPSTATTDAGGYYTLRWSPDLMGAAVGKHRVIIRTERAGFSPEGEGEVAIEPRAEMLPPEYNDETTLSRDVQEGENVIDFELETKGFKASARQRRADP